MSCGKSELCIFNRASPQIVVDNYSFETIHPVNTITNATLIEFNIRGSNEYYLDMNDTLIYIKAKAKKVNGDDLVAGSEEIPSNYLLQCLFQDAILTFNGTQIEGGNNTFAQKALIESILNYSKDTQEVFCRPMGIFETENQQKALISLSKPFVLCGPLHLDFFDQPKYLIPGVNINLKLKLHTRKFMFKKDGKLIIDEIKLYVRRVKVNPSVLAGHMHGLNTRNAIYPIRKTRVLTYSLATGSLHFYKDQIFGDSVLPKFVLITFQSTETLNGHKDYESSHFTHAKLESMTLSRNADYRETYEPTWTDGGHMLSYIQSMIRNMGYLAKNVNNGIDPGTFKTKYPFFTFVLAPDFDLSQTQLPKQGNLRLEVKFTEGLERPTSVIVYGIFDSEIQISKSGLIFV